MKKKSKVEYFVSYAYEKGFGQILISCDKEINSYDDILKFRETIRREDISIKSPVILFFKEIK